MILKSLYHWLILKLTKILESRFRTIFPKKIRCPRCKSKKKRGIEANFDSSTFRCQKCQTIFTIQGKDL